jgi:hypothetical protein
MRVSNPQVKRAGMMTYVLPNINTDYRDMGYKNKGSASDGKKMTRGQGGRGYHALSNGSWFGVVTISSFFVLEL